MKFVHDTSNTNINLNLINLVSIHGVREKKYVQKNHMKTVGDVAFDLIPSEDSYKCR